MDDGEVALLGTRVRLREHPFARDESARQAKREDTSSRGGGEGMMLVRREVRGQYEGRAAMWCVCVSLGARWCDWFVTAGS